MPYFVTTRVGETLSDIVGQYHYLAHHRPTVSIEEIANLNRVSSLKILSPFKILVLPDSGSNGMCGVLDHQAVALARSMQNKAYDPLRALLTSGWGNELLSSLEIFDGLSVDGEVKAAFGGALGASSQKYQQFLAANNDYKKLLTEFATASESQRKIMTRQIVAAARKVEELYMRVVAVFVKNRRGSLPKRMKQVPHVDMHYARARGLNATVIKNSADINRIRGVSKLARGFAAGAFILDIGFAGKNIKQAYDTGGNTTRVAFEELGGLVLEGLLAAGSAMAVGVGLVATGAFFPFLLLPGIGLAFIVGAGAAGAVYGNIKGKVIGQELYDLVEPLFREATLETY